jgi:hypothetical protein
MESAVSAFDLISILLSLPLLFWVFDKDNERRGSIMDFGAGGWSWKKIANVNHEEEG